MKNKKRIAALLLASALLCGVFSGCGGGNDESGRSGPASGGEASAGDTAQEEPETFTMFINDANFNWDNPVAEEITKRTGVIIKPDLVIDDPTQRISLMTASGEYDDLVLNVDRSMEMMRKADAYVQLDDLIEQYGPNIKEFYGDYYSRLRYSSEDPHIYGFGLGASQVAETGPGFYWNVGFFLQNGALKELGYPEIKTPEDFENALETYLKDNPTTEDGQKRIGLSLVTGDGFRFGFSISQPAAFINGLPNNNDWYYDEENDKYTWAHGEEYFKEAMRWYNRMYNKGLIDPESFTQNYDTYLAKIAQGRVVGVIDGYWQFSNAVTQLRSENPQATYMAFAPLLNPEQSKWMADQPGDVVQNGGFSITTACKNPEKLVKFFDFLASEEGQILTEHGIEGINYTLGEDGGFVRNPEDVAADTKDGAAYSAKTGVKLYARGYNQWLHRPDGWKTSAGQSLYIHDYSAASDAFCQEEKDSLANYGFEYFSDIFPKPSELPIMEFGTGNSLPTGESDDTKIAKQKLQDMRLPHLAKAIMATPEEFDAVWQEYLTDMEAAGKQILEDEINKAYQDRKEAWGAA